MKKRIHNYKTYKDLRQVLRGGATKAERILWTHIRNKQLGGYKFRRQHGIGRYIVDFYCPELRIIVELDGWVHGEDAQRKQDEVRQKYLEEQKFVVIRYINAQIRYDLESVLRDLWDICNVRAREINHP